MNCENYCDKCGNCSRCGNCCASNLPLTKKEEKKIREYIKKNNIQPEIFQTEKDINLQCCFYDRKNKLCKIYEVRPSICRSFRCNKKLETLEKEKKETHKRAYWNHVNGDEELHLTDMRLLFYNDPRSLIGNILYVITKGTMQVTEKEYRFLKKYLKENGQEELANCIKGEFENGFTE